MRRNGSKIADQIVKDWEHEKYYKKLANYIKTRPKTNKNNKEEQNSIK